MLEQEYPAPQNPAQRARQMARYADLKSFVPDRPGHDRRYAIDAAKARERLGWAPRRRFEHGLAETVQWYVQNRPWWEHILSGEYRTYYERQYGGR